MAVSRFEVSDALWEKFRRCLLPRVNTHRFGGGRPRADDRACLNGIFFVLRTGCQWNALNATRICPSSTANDRFRQWVKEGAFRRFFHGGVKEYDELAGIDWSFLSMDESGGFASTANVHDMNLFGPTLDALEELPVRRPRPSSAKPRGPCLDKGYDYPIIRELCRLFRFTAPIRGRGEEARGLKRGRRARRWGVERTHGWLNRFRRLLIRWEKDDLYYLGMLHFACGIIACRQAGLFG